MANETIRLIPVKDWAKYHLWPPIGGLRHLILGLPEIEWVILGHFKLLGACK